MRKSALFSVIGVLLVIGVGVSFAYFVSNVLSSGTGSNISGSTAELIRVTYDAGDAPLEGNNLMPGNSVSKDFTVTVEPTETEKKATYGIFLDITENTFVKCDDTNYNDLTNMCTRNAQELTYTITDGSDNVLATGDLTGVTGRVKLLTQSKTVDVDTTFNYTITITFVDTGADQNHNQNKTFNGDVVVEFSELVKNYILAHSKKGTGVPNLRYTSCTNGNNGNSSGSSSSNNGNCQEETVGLYEETTSKGTTYYFRGDVEDNYLVFANKYWRIIRINEDGSVRVIYSGEKVEVDAAGKETVLANGYDDSSTQYTQIGMSEWGGNSRHSEYVGYTYSLGYQRPSDNLSEETDSIIKGVLDEWYINNIGSQGLDSKVVSSPGFCNDRNVVSGDNWVVSGTSFHYAAYGRRNGTPTFDCRNSNDLYVTKIGLITVDEVVYAGASGSSASYYNYGYYLYTGNLYWTMSPYMYNPNVGYGTYMYVVTSNGYPSYYTVDDFVLGVRPVINLSTNVTITGSGTISDPYVVS